MDCIRGDVQGELERGGGVLEVVRDEPMRHGEAPDDAALVCRRADGRVVDVGCSGSLTTSGIEQRKAGWSMLLVGSVDDVVGFMTVHSHCVTSNTTDRQNTDDGENAEHFDH